MIGSVTATARHLTTRDTSRVSRAARPRSQPERRPCAQALLPTPATPFRATGALLARVMVCGFFRLYPFTLSESRWRIARPPRSPAPLDEAPSAVTCRRLPYRAPRTPAGARPPRSVGAEPPEGFRSHRSPSTAVARSAASSSAAAWPTRSPLAADTSNAVSVSLADSSAVAAVPTSCRASVSEARSKAPAAVGLERGPRRLPPRALTPRSTPT